MTHPCLVTEFYLDQASLKSAMTFGNSYNAVSSGPCSLKNKSVFALHFFLSHSIKIRFGIILVWKRDEINGDEASVKSFSFYFKFELILFLHPYFGQLMTLANN